MASYHMDESYRHWPRPTAIELTSQENGSTDGYLECPGKTKGLLEKIGSDRIPRPTMQSPVVKQLIQERIICNTTDIMTVYVRAILHTVGKFTYTFSFTL